MDLLLRKDFVSKLVLRKNRPSDYLLIGGSQYDSDFSTCGRALWNSHCRCGTRGGTISQQHFNSMMATVRVGVEWGFGMLHTVAHC